MKPIPESKWRWYGAPGHFICARWCRFHLCTEIGPYLISTVGEYVHPRHGGGTEKGEEQWLAKNWPGDDVGCDRKYETMVFRIDGKRCTEAKCRCGQPGIKPSELWMRGSNSAGDAIANHMFACQKYARA